MEAKKSDLSRLQNLYEQKGNQLIALYGRRGCQKEELIKEFIRDKKYFYYKSRLASPKEQCKMMGEEISRHFDVVIGKNTYQEYFKRIKSGDPSKLVVVIDDAECICKKDQEFLQAIIDLKKHKLYPGPVMIILASASTVWATKDAPEYTDEQILIEENNFLEVVRNFDRLSVADSIKIYGIIGGVPDYLDQWDQNLGIKENICRLVLSKDGYLYNEACSTISAELRELSVYCTILATIARGQNKLNELFHETGFSRAKISVYMKNLAQFNIVEKLVSFETGGWDNAKKGVYQIKDTFVNFWFKFVYPHVSDLCLMTPEEFYDAYIADELDNYMERYFKNVCMEYLLILNQMKQLPFEIVKVGTWVGKTGNIDIIAQSSDRRNIIGFCNWNEPEMTMEMCEQMATAMEKAKLSSDNYYLFSATSFEEALKHYITLDPRFKLVNMNEL